MGPTVRQRKPAAEYEPATAGNEASGAESSSGRGVQQAKQQLSRVRRLWPVLAVIAAIGFAVSWSMWLRSPKANVYTRAQLAEYNGTGPGVRQLLYVAILGEVFDVSNKAATYGPGKGYHHFTGRDASRAFITGNFKDDLTDEVSDFSPEQCLGLVEWSDFYHKTYPHKGRVAGAFFDALGSPTQQHAHVEAAAAKGRALREEQEKQKQKWPSCNMKYTQAEGGSVWCDNGMYPRKLFVQMEGGQPNWRCACFEHMGWSDLRQVYDGCGPEAHKCQVSPPAA